MAAITGQREDSVSSGRVNVEKLVATKIVCTLGPASDNEKTLEEVCAMKFLFAVSL